MTNVEVIVGRVVPTANGNYSWGKAPRTLHLPMHRDGAVVTLELDATSKGNVTKTALPGFEPDAGFALDGEGSVVLRSWLSARYNRAAFPDAFVRRMRKTKVDVRLTKKLEPHSRLISFVYFDLDGGQSLERADGDPYALNIVLVVDGNRRFDVVIRLAEQDRSTTGLHNLLIPTGTDFVPLSALAEIIETDGPNQIQREGTLRRIVVYGNGDGRRDMGAIATDIRNASTTRAPMPDCR